MKIKNSLTALVVTLIALFCVSCVTNRDGSPSVLISKYVTFEQLCKEQPFTATIEGIHFNYYSNYGKSIELVLKKPDSATRLVIRNYPVSKYTFDFANSLHEGQSYVFPKVIRDFQFSQNLFPTNMSDYQAKAVEFIQYAQAGNVQQMLSITRPITSAKETNAFLHFYTDELVPELKGTVVTKSTCGKKALDEQFNPWISVTVTVQGRKTSSYDIVIYKLDGKLVFWKISDHH